MERTASGFAFTVDRVDQDFRYAVTAAGASSREYGVTVMRPPRVERIDLGYEFPPALGMPPREEEDGGDIYGPAGTRVRVTVHTDKPVREAALALTGGDRIALSMRDGVLQGELTITEDGSYRVALADADGLTNPGDTEYFIRTLQDRPPDVRIIRPASDRQVTPLEEVAIEARAEDDFGVAALDLVYTTGGGAEKAVPFTRSDGRCHRDGPTDAVSRRPQGQARRRRRVLRACSRSQPRQTVERGTQRHLLPRGHPVRGGVRRIAESGHRRRRQQSGARGTDPGAERHHHRDMEPRSSWARSRRPIAGRHPHGCTRSTRRARPRDGDACRDAARERSAATAARRPWGGGAAQAGDAMAEAVGRAVTAMAGASQQLDALKTSTALPHEMTALNELLRAQAEVRRREIQQQQANGTGGAGITASSRICRRCSTASSHVSRRRITRPRPAVSRSRSRSPETRRSTRSEIWHDGRTRSIRAKDSWRRNRNP